MFGERLQMYYADSPDPAYRKYPNCIYKPLLDWQFKTKNVFERSGLFELGIVPYHYRGEILNTKNSLTPKHINSEYEISQRELFQYFPGIYYNFTCRDPC